MAQETTDNLGLNSDANFQKLLQKENLGEVVYSNIVNKVNRKGKVQERGLCITSEFLLNLKKTGIFSKSWEIKRKIKLNKIGSLSKSRAKIEEFAVHVPTDYDYQYRSTKRDEIVDILQRAVEGKGVQVVVGEVDEITDVVVDRPASKNISREKRWQKYHDKIKVTAANAEAVAQWNQQAERERPQIKPLQSYQQATPVCRGDFELLQVLGQGSFGKVLKVREKKTDDILAMKVLNKKDVIEKKQVEHTNAEQEVLATMNHPFLMGMKYAFQTDNQLFFCLHYYPGGELFFHLTKENNFKLEACRLMVAETALAIGHLHGKGFIYRDLKPENLLLDAEGHICVTDFGLAKDMTECGTTRTFCGTPEYLAPEIVKNLPHDKAVDWWSVGILLYELGVGQPPFYDRQTDKMYEKILKDKLVFPTEFQYRDGTSMKIPKEYMKAVTGLLKRDPKARLGAGADDVEEIMAQPFFRVLNREQLLAKKIQPTYVPDKEKVNVDDEFRTMEPVLDSPAAALTQRQKKQDKFDKFAKEHTEGES